MAAYAAGVVVLLPGRSVGERAEGGPPQVSEDDIRFELGRLFEFVHLRHIKFESPLRPQGYLGWSCLMRRPEVR